MIPQLLKSNFLFKIFAGFNANKNIVVFIGNKGVYLTAVNNYRIIDQLFIPGNEKIHIENYKYFFSKLKKYKILLLIDCGLSKTVHELVPNLSSVVQLDPISTFITQHYKSTDIVAYDIYEIANSGNEAYHTLISSTPENSLITNIIEYLLKQRFIYSGLYFINLEFTRIINELLKKANKYDTYNNFLQIFITTLKVGEIKVVIKYKDNIINAQTIEYNDEWTTPYIEGIIEQQVADNLIKFKNFIEEKKLKTCIILLVEEEINNSLDLKDFNNLDILFIKTSDLSSNYKTTNRKFFDPIIAAIFLAQKGTIGYNHSLKTISKLQSTDSYIFKILFSIIAFLTISLASTKYKIWQTTRYTKSLNKQYYIVDNQYKQLQNKYPEINNLHHLAELRTLESDINRPSPTPNQLIHRFIANIDHKVILKTLAWRITNFDNNLSFSKKPNNVALELTFKYKTEGQDEAAIMQELNNYITNLSTVIFKDYNVEANIIEDEFNDIAKTIVIPVHLTIADKI